MPGRDLKACLAGDKNFTEVVLNATNDPQGVFLLMEEADGKHWSPGWVEDRP